MNTELLLDAAHEAREAGLSVVPPAQDGTKRPQAEPIPPECEHPDCVKVRERAAERGRPATGWVHRQHVAADVITLEQWYANGRSGLGVVCGAVSGGLEMFEFEGRAVDEGIYARFVELAHSVGHGALVERIMTGYTERTPSGGLHLLYRVEGGPIGNTKLARRPATEAELAVDADDKVRVLIETRGEGGYTITAPSSGTVHPDGGRWEMLTGSFSEIVTITAQERDDLHRLARLFDTLPTAAPRQPLSNAGPPSGGRSPWEDYDARPDAPQRTLELLERHGWTEVYRVGDVVYLAKPGKRRPGLSATLGHVAPGVLYVFSTSTVFDEQRGYGPFDVYKILEHGGDGTEAARVLRAEGYGDPPPVLTANGPIAVPPAGDPPMDDGGIDAPRRHECTDLGNARRLVDNHGADLRYVAQWGRWLAWDGARWAIDETGEAHRRAKDVVESILTEVTTEADADRRKALMKHWMRSQAAPRLSAIVSVASTEADIALRVDQLDAEPWLLNVANGTIDLRTGRRGPHRREQHLTKLAPVEHDPAATAPTWRAFVEKVMGGDAELVSFLQRAVGYSLTGNVGEQVLLFCWGTGANGKSTLLGTLQQLLGDYAVQAAPNLLVSQENEHPTAIADLVGRRFAVCQEVDQGRRLAEALVKQLTGGDLVKARYMRQDFFTFAPSHKLWLAANHKPTVRGTDHAIWRRIRLIPFDVTIPDAEQDHHLPEKLAAELPGILNWALEGCLAWQRDGLVPPAAVSSATAGYRDENDVVGMFIEEQCTLGSDAEVTAASLRQAYVEWCERNGERPMSQRAFAPHLLERGCEKVKESHSRRSVWRGLSLRRVAEDPS